MPDPKKVTPEQAGAEPQPLPPDISEKPWTPEDQNATPEERGQEPDATPEERGQNERERGTRG